MLLILPLYELGRASGPATESKSADTLTHTSSVKLVACHCAAIACSCAPLLLIYLALSAISPLSSSLCRLLVAAMHRVNFAPTFVDRVAHIACIGDGLASASTGSIAKETKLVCKGVSVPVLLCCAGSRLQASSKRSVD